ncbi:MAG: peptide-methionine (S)-S-oxide reductase [Verrucomicrobiota bacterium]|nr:peptide-methionine (S)-S-oxide reductase [Verrucomicrobiota bacterium]
MMAQNNNQEIYLAGGCLWGVQEFFRYIPGVISTEAGRANGSSQSIDGAYDGYAECVRILFDSDKLSVNNLISHLFEIIDPYSINKQGPNSGRQYRTGVYSRSQTHLHIAREFIEHREDSPNIAVEVLPLDNYVKSHKKHQDRLMRMPNDPCHLSKDLLHKYRKI